jgi:hypothetical protein
MPIRIIPTNSIKAILAYGLKCTCSCQSRVEQIESKWDETVATKGPSLKAYWEDLQLAYKMLRDPVW